MVEDIIQDTGTVTDALETAESPSAEVLELVRTIPDNIVIPTRLKVVIRFAFFFMKMVSFLIAIIIIARNINVLHKI